MKKLYLWQRSCGQSLQIGSLQIGGGVFLDGEHGDGVLVVFFVVVLGVDGGAGGGIGNGGDGG